MTTEQFATSINDQGTFLNSCTKVISQTPIIDLAYLSNTSDNSDSDLILSLNPICLTWCDFKNLFFTSNSSAFWINPVAVNSCAITINQQTYETTQAKCLKFNLAEQIKKAWSRKTSKLESSIPPQANLTLNKDVFYVRSLAVSKYAIGLSLDQVISTLLANNQITSGDSSSSAKIQFTISYRFYFAPLDTSVLAIFNYITKIPCFSNTETCDLCPYSNANQNCRPCFNIPDDNTLSSFLNDNHANKFEEYNYDEQSNGNATIISGDSSSHYLTNILDSESAIQSNVGGNKTFISDTSSSLW